MQQFFSQPHADQPSILQQLDEMGRDGLGIDGHAVQVVWKGGGDLKFQSEILGLNGHSSNHPCTHCECPKELLHLRKADLMAASGITRRTLLRAKMMSHKWGPEWGLEQPYACPGCAKTINEHSQHLPHSATQVKNWPRAHRGHYYNCLPVLPVEFWDFIPDLLHALLRSVANMFFITVSMNLRTEQQAANLSDFIQAEYGVKTNPVFNQGTRSATLKTLQTLNGEECWRILKNIRQILSQVFPDQESEAYNKVLEVWESWEDLYATLLIPDVEQERWEELATTVEEKAAVWHRTFLQVTGPNDVTPFMHEVVVHFGDFIRLVGPLLPFSSEGLEARHQPIKRLGKYRTNRKGVGAVGTGSDNTDIMQTMRRDCATEYVKQKVPKGKGAKKARGTDKRDALCRRLHRLQIPVLVRLQALSTDEAAALLEVAEQEEAAARAAGEL